MLKELVELRRKIRDALAAGDSDLVVRLTQQYLDLHDKCYPS